LIRRVKIARLFFDLILSLCYALKSKELVRFIKKGGIKMSGKEDNYADELGKTIYDLTWQGELW